MISQRAIVTLTWPEISISGDIAIRRRMRGLQGQAIDRYGAGDNGGLGADYEWIGVIGEIAVAKFLNTFWPGMGMSIGAVDAGRAEVRTVDADHKRLIAHEGDRDDLPFISALVTRALLPEVVLRGWSFGRDAKQPKFWCDPGTGRAAFFVDNDCLLPMSELHALLMHSEAAE